jgi:hypothetical protein
MTFTRRVFFQLSATVAAWLGRARGPAAAQPTPSTQGGGVAGLGARDLLPLAQAVLPAELGTAGIERAVNEFAAFIAGYRPGAEAIHPYGSERLGRVPEFSPAPWLAQLRALDAAARSRHGRAFADIAVADRTALVQDALASLNVGARIGARLAAPHVALGLLTHFLDSPAATNLAYQRVIDPRQCRPLAASPQIPVPLRRATGGGAGR